MKLIYNQIVEAVAAHYGLMHVDALRVVNEAMRPARADAALRDEFAKMVFSQLTAFSVGNDPTYITRRGFGELAEHAYAAADAMLRARAHGETIPGAEGHHV